MQTETTCNFHLSVRPENYEAFAELVSRIVSATRTEPGTLSYEYHVNPDRSAVHIVERYRTPALLGHVEETFAPFAERFLELATIERLYVYGATTPEIRAKLDGFGAVYMAPMDGFTR
jgi:quinol monooxygenase YgiN